jgi:hypothetical protein
MDVYDLMCWAERQVARNKRTGERFNCPMTILDGRLDGLTAFLPMRSGWSKHTTGQVGDLAYGKDNSMPTLNPLSP